MAVHSNCPKCQKQVLVPEGAGDAVVRCPLCHEEYELSEAHALLAPALIVVRPSSTVATAGLAAVSAGGASLLQEREHVIPVTLGHDDIEEFKFSDEPHSAFHDDAHGLELAEVHSDDVAPDHEAHAGEEVHFLAAPHLDSDPLESDIIAIDPDQPFDPEHAFEPVAEVHSGDVTMLHDENPFGAELFGEHAHQLSPESDQHGDGIQMLEESAAVEADAPWNPSNWGGESGHSNSHDHEHPDGDEIAIAEDDDMGAVDFANITGNTSADDAEPGSAPAKKKKRKPSSGGGLGRLVGIAVSGLMAVPCVLLLAAYMSPSNDWLKIRPYLPFLKKTAAAPVIAKSAASNAAVNPKATPPKPSDSKVAEVNATPPAGPVLSGPQQTEPPVKPQPDPNPNQTAGATPKEARPNLPFGEGESKSPAKTDAVPPKTSDKVAKNEGKAPDNQLADASSAKKPMDKSVAKEPVKPDDAGDPFSTPAGTGAAATTPEAKADPKPVDSKPDSDDPLTAPPAKPDTSLPGLELKPIAPVGSNEAAPKEGKPEDMPAIPDAKPDVKPPDVKPVDTKPADAKPEIKPAEKPAAGDDPFSTPDSKPDPKPEMKLDAQKPDTPKPDTPKPDTPKPDDAKPAEDIPATPEVKREALKPAGDVPAKPDLKPELAPEHKPEMKLETKPEIKTAVAAVKPAPFDAASITTAAGYDALCKTAELAAKAKGSDEDKKYLASVLVKLAADTQAAGKLTAMAKSKLDDASATGGIVLTGSVIISKNKGDLFGTALKIEGQEAPVMVFSSHALDVSAADKIVVPGSIVREPAKNIPGYTGKQPVIVWADSVVKLP